MFQWMDYKQTFVIIWFKTLKKKKKEYKQPYLERKQPNNRTVQTKVHIAKIAKSLTEKENKQASFE